MLLSNADVLLYSCKLSPAINSTKVAIFADSVKDKPIFYQQASKEHPCHDAPEGVLAMMSVQLHISYILHIFFSGVQFDSLIFTHSRHVCVKRS